MLWARTHIRSSFIVYGGGALVDVVSERHWQRYVDLPGAVFGIACIGFRNLCVKNKGFTFGYPLSVPAKITDPASTDLRLSVQRQVSDLLLESD